MNGMDIVEDLLKKSCPADLGITTVCSKACELNRPELEAKELKQMGICDFEKCWNSEVLKYERK